MTQREEITDRTWGTYLSAYETTKKILIIKGREVVSKYSSALTNFSGSD